VYFLILILNKEKGQSWRITAY